jgi:hypothetical protein
VAQGPNRLSLSIVIPAISDPSPQFSQSQKSFSQLTDVEIIYVDQSEAQSRAERLNIGFKKSSGSMVLFYHPRSFIETRGLEYLKSISQEKIWGGFTHHFDVDHWLLQFTSWYSNRIRPKTSGILYLDHCIFFHRSFFSVPLAPVDIFEDTLLSQQLSLSSKPVVLDFESNTSAIRFQIQGMYRQALYNQVLKLGYYLGLPPEKMNKFYEAGLGLNSDYTKK